MARSSVRLLLALTIWRVVFLQLAVAPPPPEGDGDNHCHAQDANSKTAADVDSVDGSSCKSESLSPASDQLNNNNEQKWKWEPTSKSHPCNIRRISRSELLRSYGDQGVPNLYPHPLVIYHDDKNSKINEKSDIFNLTTFDNLPSNFPPDFNVILTGSDSLSSHRRTIPLTQYLNEVLASNNGRGETLPNQLGNETWYLFGETFSDEWAEFLQNYELPPCQSCTPLHREQNLIALSFGIGNIGSGVQWHLHGPGFSETIHGRKHWVLYPPEHRPMYDLDYASRHWMENTYPGLEDWTDDDMKNEEKKHAEYLNRFNNNIKRGQGRGSNNAFGVERGPSSKKPWECTINEGEMIYFPDQWHHATINLEKYTVFVSSFTTEH